MRFRLSTLLALTSCLSLAGCNLDDLTGNHGSNATQANASPQGKSGVLGFLRPKPDAATIERMHQEDAIRKQKADEQAAQLLKDQQDQQKKTGEGGGGFDMSALTRLLPKVSTDPIAPPAEEVAKDGPVFSPAQGNNQAASSPAQIASAGATPAAPPVASYGGYGSATPPPPPGSTLIPPPPAVSLSTQVNMSPAQMPYADPNNPYANPYMNPYGVPYPQQAAGQAQSAHPPDSFFGSGGKSNSSDSGSEEDPAAAERAKKLKDFVPITPTGMDPISPYKQRDDLRVLWKGAISSAALRDVAQSKFGDQLQRVDVSLPNGPSRGNFAIDQHTLNTLYGNAQVDARIAPSVHKAQLDVAQSYYRYLYTYNKYSLAQQTLQARKQEVDVASSPAEQQRASTDLAAAQQEVDSAKDDMTQAQKELAITAGPTAARTVIGHVSHVTPSQESLASSAEPQGNNPAGQDIGSRALHFFGFGHSGGGNSEAPQAEPLKVASSDSKESKKKGKDKEKPSKKEAKDSKDKAGDLSPAPPAAVTAPLDNTGGADPGAPPTVATSPEGISFELKGVNVTPRKSVLTVAIKNSGANNYSFSPSDAFSLSEGNRKISEAAVRADFDTTLVQPNSEVKGTITIFGRPWSEKLAVVLSDGGKSIQMRRQ